MDTHKGAAGSPAGGGGDVSVDGHSLEASHLVGPGLVLEVVGLQLDQIHLGLLFRQQATGS